jgi:hypothetical protein
MGVARTFVATQQHTINRAPSSLEQAKLRYDVANRYLRQSDMKRIAVGAPCLMTLFSELLDEARR